MKSENWLIVEFAAALVIFGVLSFFVPPTYEKGAWFVMGTLSTGLGTILGYKFGKNLPSQANRSDQVPSGPAAPPAARD